MVAPYAMPARSASSLCMPYAATLCCPMPPHCAAPCCHTVLPYAATHVAALPRAAALCCPMPTYCAAPSRHTVLPYAATPRCSSGVCPRLARATTNKPINHPEPSGSRTQGASPRCDPAKPNRIRFLGAETEPIANPVPERQNRTESGSWMPEPNRIRPPRPRNRTESGPAMAGTEPNSNLGFANRTRRLTRVH